LLISLEYIGTEFNLLSINQDELIKTINKVYEERKIINVKPLEDTTDSESD
jgi:hypothetical protein